MRLTAWLLTVAVMTAAGTLTGAAIGELLARLSLDYPVVPSSYSAIGFRLGLFSGTFHAACQVMTDLPLPAFRDLLRAASAFCIVAGTIVLLLLGGAVVISCCKVCLDQFPGLAHPRRYIIYRGVHYAWISGAIGGTVAGGWRLFRRRCDLQISRGSLNG